jgi:hypothetical protein
MHESMLFLSFRLRKCSYELLIVIFLKSLWYHSCHERIQPVVQVSSSNDNTERVGLSHLQTWDWKSFEEMKATNVCRFWKPSLPGASMAFEVAVGNY